jgi:hypothetical protein
MNNGVTSQYGIWKKETYKQKKHYRYNMNSPDGKIQKYYTQSILTEHVRIFHSY